jgi:hypothetical protein
VDRSMDNVASEMRNHRGHSSWPAVVSVLVSRCSEFRFRIFRYDMDAITFWDHSFRLEFRAQTAHKM